jgi:hypothetical protein
VGGANLNADLTLSGTTHTNAGTYSSDPWSFTDPSGNYAPANGTVSDTINPEVPTLTFATIPTHTYGDAPFEVTATDGANTPYNGPITYALTNGYISAGTVIPFSTNSGWVTLTGAGMVYLTASQPASGNYAAATATTSFVVNPEVPTLTFATIPTHTYGDAPFQVTATDSASTPSNGAINYALTAGQTSSGTVTSSGVVTLTGAGTVYLTANQMASGNYAATTATTSFTVDPALIITTTNPLPAGVVGTSYSQTLTATGGSGTYTTWAVTANNSGLTNLGLSLTSSSGVWSISGSSASLVTGSATFTVQVTDSIGATTTQQLTINVYEPLALPAPNPASLGAALTNQYYNGSISGSGGSGNYSWSVTGLSSTSLNYNSTGNPLTISGTAPATAQTLTLNVTMTDTTTGKFVTQNGYIITDINPNVGYNVSGTVSYSGPDTGWIYLKLGNNLGTAIYGPGAFTIQGVPPGTYTLQAWMDNLGYGGRNASNPTGSTQNVTVPDGPLSGVTVSLSNPATVTLGSATPTWDSSEGSGEFSGGAFVSFDPICNGNGCNNGGVEMPASYEVQYSTSSSFSSVAGSQCFPATGEKSPWIVSGISGSGPYYFRAAGNVGACGSSTSGLTWSAASPAMTIGAPSSGNLVQGTVTFSAPAGGITGPLYVGFYDMNTGNIYADVVGSQASPPASPASYSVYVPTGSSYYFFGVIDQNNDGLMVPGDISNTNEQNMASVDIDPAISSTLTQNLTLPSTNGAPTNAQAIVRTNSSQQTNLSGYVSYNYGVDLRVDGLYKLPASVDLYSGPSYIVNAPADIATGAFNGNTDEWDYNPSMNGGTPSTSDVFIFNVTYTDGASNSTANTPSNPLIASPTGVLSAWATNMSPTWNTGSASTTPTFTWSYPTGAANYAYQFQLTDSNHNTIWSIPAQHSNSNGFSSNITPSITWGVDPTGGGSKPSVMSLNPNSTYYWTISANDSNENGATTQVSFQTGEAPLSLPASGALGSGTVNQAYNGSITASGGSETGYSFTVGVNGAGATGGTSWTLPDGLSASSSGGTLTISGTTSTTPATITLAVGVTDSESHTASGTYTISIISSQVAFPASGNVSYHGSQTGWIYLSLNPTNNCNNAGCNNPNPGTAISAATLASGGAFTINGVQPGTYNLNAWMDNSTAIPGGFGAPNASNPTGRISNVTVNNGTLSGVSVSLNNPGPVSLSSAPSLNAVSGFDDGAMISFSGIYGSNPIDNWVEQAASYTVEWSSTQNFNTVAGSHSFAAAGANMNGSSIWILNTASVAGLTQGGTYYFRAQGVAGSSTSNWSNVLGPVTISAPSAANTVSGTVTFSQTPTGPLYVGFWNQSTNSIYATAIGSQATPPTSPASYSVQVPTGNNYFFIGILDQNNDGIIDTGDITTTNGDNMTLTAVNGSATQNLVLPSGNSNYELMTGNVQNDYYYINIDLSGVGKMPVAVTMLSGANVQAPEDIAQCGNCGNQPFNFVFVNYVSPTVGSSYGLQITYSDGTSETLSKNVSAVLGIPINLSPAGISGTNTTPTFTWTDPANASNYVYQFGLTDDVYNRIWLIPSNPNNLDGFPSTYTSIPWNADPTGTGSTLSVSSLTPGMLYNWWVTAIDANGNWSETGAYYVPDYTPLALPTPNPSTLGTAVAGQSYNGTIVVTGGYGPYYWSVNGCTWNCTVSIGNGLTASFTTADNNTLTISGTPTSTSTVSFTAYVYDSTWSTPTATYTYTIHVNEYPLSLPASGPLNSATINQSYTAYINASGGSGSGYVWSINGTTVPTNGGGLALTDGLSAYSSGGNTLNISGTLGSNPQTITLNNVSVTDSASDTETSATYTIPVINPNAGYAVSGTVSYGGPDTGWIYLKLGNNLGTAIYGPGAFTIQGVPPGTYTLQAWMDNLGYGGTNASNPTGSTQNVVVTDGTVSGVSVSLSNPATVTLGTATPGFDANNGLGAFNGGALIGFDPICNGSGCNNGGVEMPASYEVQYSTSSSFSSVAGSQCFPATGANGTSPYIITGLTNSLTYYFRAAGNVGVCGSSTTGLNYSAAVPSGGLLIGAPSTGSVLSGTVTFTLPTGISASGKTLYVGCVNMNSGAVYAEPITSPISPQAYSIDVPNGTSCEIFGFIDLNNTGLIGGVGEISNTNNGQGMVAVTVNGTTSGQNITLPSGNSIAVVKTQTKSSGGGANYNVGFQVYGEYKLPVAVELASETPYVTGTAADVVMPADIATGAFNGNSDEFDYWPNVTGTPVVGDSYKFNVTYSDGTSEQLTAAVTGVLNAFATGLSPTGSGVSTMPNFSWNYPSNASSYVYQFELDDNNGNRIWEIPAHHSNSNGFASTITPSITWGVDPTNTGDLPSVSSLKATTTYNWSIAAYDANMNEAQVGTSFQTWGTSLSLPATNPSTLPATTVVNQQYYGSVSVTGGVAPYNWQVNNLSDNLGWYTGSDGTALIISGGPSNTGAVTFQVMVTDSTGASYGPVSYTINVNPYATGYWPVYGQISFNGCQGISPPVTLTLSGSGITLTAVSDGTGMYQFPSVPNGTYTITPSITGPASVFSPASLPVTVASSYVNGNNFNAYLGYTVSGTVGYNGAKTGPIYLAMNGCQSPAPGTAILAPGAFTIRGVPPGAYTLQAWMDNLGYGAQNLSNPLGSTSNVLVPNANNSNITIGMTDPAPAILSPASTINFANGFANGAVLTFSPATGWNSFGNSVESATSYTVEWSATRDFSSVVGSTSFPASGWAPGHWILNTASVPGLTQGDTYYFRVQGIAGSSTSNWSNVMGPATISAPPTANTVSGQITFSQKATGPLYVGFLDQNTYGKVYLTQVGSAAAPPTSPASYSLQVPSGNNYFFFAVLDQNNDGMIDSGDITNVDGFNMIVPAVAISGSATENLTLPSGNSSAVVRTENGYFSLEWGAGPGYTLYLDVTPVGKLPIAVELTSVPAGSNILTPADVAWCFSCGLDKFSSFNPSYNFDSTAPTVGSSYGVKVSYPDGTSDTAAPQVTAIVPNWTTNLSPAGPQSAINGSPDFTWTYPANAGSYLYNFWLGDVNWNTVWSIPNIYSGSNDFTSALSPSITWASDPTDPINTPTISTLSTGAIYYWEVQVFDTHGNYSTYLTDLVSGFTTLALPAANPSSLGAATIGQSYSGTITASGGYGGYNYAINGINNCYGCTNISLGNGLTVTNASNTLTITGTPIAAGSVNFTVYVQDQTWSGAVGPIQYTIYVSEAPLMLPSQSSASLPTASINQFYNGYIVVSGGSGEGYSWTVNGSPVPVANGGTPLALPDGLTATVDNEGGECVNGSYCDLHINQTPTTAENVTLNVTVTDSANDTTSQTYTIPVVNPAAGYTTSGTASYGGSKTGWIYLSLGSCAGCIGNYGTAIPSTALASGGAFTIRGVKPGTYYLNAWMDNLGDGVQNASNPTGSTANVTVTNSTLSGTSVTLADPPAVTLSSAPTWSGTQGTGAFSGGAFVSFGTIRNSNGIEIPTSYTLEWSTDSTFNTGVTSKSFPATSAVSPRMWLFANSDAYSFNPWIVTGLTNGDTYYFRAAGVVGSGSSAVTGPWSAVSPGLLIEAPSIGNAVSGTVTFSQTANGPLYVGFYDQTTGNTYVDVIASPKSPQAYAVNVPTGSNYFFFAFIDQNNDGLIDLGDISNTNGFNMITPAVAISGTTTQNLTLSSANSWAVAFTENNIGANLSDTTFSQSYALDLMVSTVNKLPVSVTLLSGANVLAPVDIAACQGCGYSPNNRFWAQGIELNSAVAPTVGAAYGLQITYSDGTSETLSPQVTAVLPNSSLASNLSPAGPQSATNTTPTFTWNYPASGAGSYFYQLWLANESNNWNTVWSIPNLNSPANGFTSSVTPSIPWGVDPTDPSNTPSVSSLTNGDIYYWELVAYDAYGNRAQASVDYVSGFTALALPAANPSSLGPAILGQPYSGSISASGGYGYQISYGYSWSFNCTTCFGGNGNNISLGNGLTVTVVNGALQVTGTPNATGLVSFTVYVRDMSGAIAGPVQYTINITAADGLSLPATNPSSLPLTTIFGLGYYGSVTVIGGVGPYTWQVNNLSDNLGWSTNGADNATLFISGQPPNQTDTVTFNVTVSDSTGASYGPETYTITVNPPVAGTYVVISSVNFNNGCGGNNPAVTLTLSGSGFTQTAATDGDGHAQFMNVPNGTYTLTPSITGATSSVFIPASQQVVVNGASIGGSGINFNAYLAYTVSGQVNYSGADTGQVYISLTGCGNTTPGTSISAPGAFTIRGVPPGQYTLNAWMDNLGYGVQNASNPTGSTSNVLVPNGNITDLSVGMTDPTAVTLSSAPTWTGQASGAFSGGAIVSFTPIKNSSNVEIPTSYTLEYSTDSTFNTGVASKSFPATGGNNAGLAGSMGIGGTYGGNSPWIVNGLTNNDTYYFRAAGVVGSGSSAVTGPWSAVSPGLLIDAPSSGNPVSGTVTFSAPSGGTITGPLYVGFWNQNTGIIYAEEITNPVSPQSYSVNVPSGSNYFFFAFIDQNNDGEIDPGDITNAFNYSMITPSVNVVGALSNQNLTLSSANSVVTMLTENDESLYFSSSNQSWYGLNLMVSTGNKLPVSVELLSGANVIAPMDIAATPGGGYNPNDRFFGEGIQLNSALAPTVGSAYGVKVVYSDGTSETLNPQVTNVLPNGPTNPSPAGGVASTNTTPTFTWNYPASDAGSYLYQFYIADTASGWNVVWEIPNIYAASNPFTNSVASIPWGVDLTDPNNKPWVSTLVDGNVYWYELVAYDTFGNRAQYITTFVPGYTALALPAPNPSSLGSAILGQPYSGSITATGGYPYFGNYSYSVNSANCYGCGVPLGNGLTITGNYGTLTIGGTPNATGPVSFTVYVEDASGAKAGPVTYTINITSQPLTLTTSGPTTYAFVNQPFSQLYSATGGSGSGYTFTVNGQTVPTNGSSVTLTNGDALTAAISSANTLNFSGTPYAVQNLSFAINVMDSQSHSITPTFYVDVVAQPSGASNGNLYGTYVCKVDGFNDRDGSRWASLASFQANGSGGLNNGVWDTNGRDFTTAMSGTMNGSYNIGADNNGVMNMSGTLTSGGTGTFSNSWAIALSNAGEPASPAQEFRMVETDDIGANASGQHSTADCYLATTGAFAASTIGSNGFAFGFQGEDDSGNPKAYVGRFTAVAGSSGGTISTGIFDGMAVNQSGDEGGSITSGSYTVPGSTTGRFTLAFTAGGYTSNFAGYIIDANRMFLLSIDNASGNGVVDGYMRTQQQSSYTGANLDGNFVLYWQGYGYKNGSVAGYGITLLQGTGDGAGNFTINQSYDDSNGAYSVGSEVGGPIAMTFDSSNPGRVYFSPGGGTIYMYFFNDNNAFFLMLNGGSPSSLDTGWMESQTQTTFTNAALAGNYLFGQLPLMIPAMSGTVREWDFDNAGNITGDATNGGNGVFTYDVPVSSTTYTWLSTTYGTFSAPTGTTGRSCAVINSTRVACIGNTTTTPGVIILQQ